MRRSPRQIAANVKIVGIILVAAIFWDHIDYWLNWVGIAVFFLATFACARRPRAR